MPNIPIPEVTNHTSLLAAIAVIRAEIEHHEHELHGVNERVKKTAAGAAKAADDLVNATDPDGGRVDDQSLAEIREIAAAGGEAVAACETYVARAKDTVTTADNTATTIKGIHGNFQEARNSAPVAAPNRAFLTPQ